MQISNLLTMLSFALWAFQKWRSPRPAEVTKQHDDAVHEQFHLTLEEFLSFTEPFKTKKTTATYHLLKGLTSRAISGADIFFLGVSVCIWPRTPFKRSAKSWDRAC